ncbi:unnamed protein product [Parajaminaea phylloscopi]
MTGTTRSLFSHESAQRPRVCTIAGSDSGGGAGIQADLKTFLALGAYGLSVITALTAQNTTGVSAIHVPPMDFLQKQLRAVTEDIRIDAFKIGMLANAEVIGAVAGELKASPTRAPVVLDPVMVSTSGSLLLSHDSIQTLIADLLPLCSLLTPNLPEAKQLLAHSRRESAVSGSSSDGSGNDSVSLASITELMDAARSLSELGPPAVLVKGGHQPFHRDQLDEALARLGIDEANHQYVGASKPSRSSSRSQGSLAASGALLRYGTRKEGDDGPTVVVVQGHLAPHSSVLQRLTGQGVERQVVLDVLYTRPAQTGGPGTYTLFVGPMLRQTSTHGTGCTLSSALATYLSEGDSDSPMSADALQVACWKAIQYVQASILRGHPDLGSGPGALDHAINVALRGVQSSSARSITSPDSSLQQEPTNSATASDLYAAKLMGGPERLGSDPTPFTVGLISRSVADWKAYVEHTFISRLAVYGRAVSDDKEVEPLPVEAFLYFLKQDYHFLLHYSRVWATAASNATSFTEAQLFLDLAKGMASEAGGHVKLCEDFFGLTKDDLEQEPEGAATVAYTRFVLDIARSGDGTLALLTATMPCLLGYAEMATVMSALTDSDYDPTSEKTLSAEQRRVRQGLHTWWTQYAGEEYLAAVRAGVAKLEEEAHKCALSPLQTSRLQQVWNAAVRLEAGMWDEAIQSATAQRSSIWDRLT